MAGSKKARSKKGSRKTGKKRRSKKSGHKGNLKNLKPWRAYLDAFLEKHREAIERKHKSYNEFEVRQKAAEMASSGYHHWRDNGFEGTAKHHVEHHKKRKSSSKKSSKKKRGSKKGSKKRSKKGSKKW